VLALLAGSAAALSWLPAHGARRASIQGVIEPEAIPLFSATGGRIAEVLAQRGERVVAGQLLLRFESTELDSRLARAHSVLRTVPDHVVEDATSFFERLPPATLVRLERTDPHRIAAEQEYSDALVELEHNASVAGQARLKRAEEQRKEAYRRAGDWRAAGLSPLRNLQSEGLQTLHWLEVQRTRFEIRAPADGVIEILNLKTGDAVPPMSRLALLDVQGRFVVEARVPEHREKEAKPGRPIEVILSGGVRMPGVVESLEGRQLRALLVNPPIAPIPGDSVQVFF
jgi:multidrug resistance efflux pump